VVRSKLRAPFSPLGSFNFEVGNFYLGTKNVFGHFEIIRQSVFHLHLNKKPLSSDVLFLYFHYFFAEKYLLYSKIN